MLCGCRIGVWWFQRLVWESVQKKWLILVGRSIRIQTCHRKIWNPWFDKNARLHLMEEKDGFCIEEDGVEILVAARWVLGARRHLQHFQTFKATFFLHLERPQEAWDEDFKLLCVFLLCLNHTEDKAEKAKHSTIWKNYWRNSRGTLRQKGTKNALKTAKKKKKKK